MLEMLVLAGCGAWWGLCNKNDPLCAPFQSDGGRQMLRDRSIPPSHSFHLSHTSRRERLRSKITLQVEDSSTWVEWSEALNAWIVESGFSDWPTWKFPPSSRSLLGGPLTAKSKKDGSDWIIQSSTVAQSFVSVMDTVDFTIYVPKRVPCLVVEESTKKRSRAITVDSSLLVTIVQNLTAMDEEVKQSMSYITSFLPNRHETERNHQGIEEWLRNVALQSYNQARDQLVSVREALLQSHSEILVTSEIAERWLEALETIKEAHIHSEAKRWQESILRSEMTEVQLESISLDPTLMPHLNLQLDHGLAIFAPLLFPLLLPMIAGFVREYKRYTVQRTKTK